MENKKLTINHYEIKLTDENGDVIFHFIKVEHKITGKVGWYDLVKQKFYPDPKTYISYERPNLDIKDYVEIEYIEPNTQFINTGVEIDKGE